MRLEQPRQPCGHGEQDHQAEHYRADDEQVGSKVAASVEPTPVPNARLRLHPASIHPRILTSQSEES